MTTVLKILLVWTVLAILAAPLVVRLLRFADRHDDDSKGTT